MLDLSNDQKNSINLPILQSICIRERFSQRFALPLFDRPAVNVAFARSVEEPKTPQ